jgi:hypothetical protein
MPKSLHNRYVDQPPAVDVEIYNTNENSRIFANDKKLNLMVPLKWHTTYNMVVELERSMTMMYTVMPLISARGAYLFPGV